MSRIRTIVRVEIDNIYDRNLLRDNPATAIEVAELAAECERVGIPEGTKARHSAYCFEAPLAETSLVVAPAVTEGSVSIRLAPGAKMHRGQVNIGADGESPKWRAARWYTNEPGVVYYLAGNSGTWTKSTNSKVNHTFIRDEDES